MKRTVILLLGILILFVGCSKYLDQVDPTGPTGDDFFSNEQELNYALISVYAGLSTADLYGRRLIGIEQLSDNVYFGSTIVDGTTTRWSNFSYDVSDQGINNTYRDLYIAINRANIVIAKAPNVPGMSDAEIKDVIAQAKFIRAHSYMLLTLLFGDVPILTEPAEDPAGAYVEKSSAEDVYGLIISDLEAGESDLPPSQAEKGKVTSWAAKSMLAKVYLYGAGELNRPEWYALAEQYSDEVIASGIYSLYFDENKTPTENLMDIFARQNETRTDKEEIFYIQHYNDGSNWGNGDVATQIPISYMSRQDRKLKLWGFGNGYIFEANFSIWEEGDARKDYTMWFHGEAVVVDGDTLGYYNQANEQRANAKINGYGMQKFWYPENFKVVNGQSTMNWPVLRYSDLLLINAEADLMADNSLSAGGLEALNLVRNRAGLASLSVGEVDRNVILHERRVELFGEFQRWFDLLRTETAEQEFVKIKAGDTDGDDTEKEGFNPARNYKFPLPQRALERNPALIQNPAWSGSSE